MTTPVRRRADKQITVPAPMEILSAEFTADRIARRAYDLYLRRGRELRNSETLT